jgi:hypothetical protein
MGCKRSRPRNLLLVVLAVSLFSSAPYAASGQTNTEETRIIPDELYRYAQSRACKQVSNFYLDHPDVREPPFVYGILAPEENAAFNDYSAALWCEPEEGTTGYTLLLKLNGRPWPGGCPDRIDYQGDPRGLSVIRMLDEPLEWYRDVASDAPVSGIARNERTRGPGIQSIYDGLGHIYYCHLGTWLARLLH